MAGDLKTEFDDGADEAQNDGPKVTGCLQLPPDRGRVIIVNFELAGRSVGTEMRKPGRPCIVLQNNKLRRGRLVTVIPLSSKAPEPAMPYHHLMDHRSFQTLPLEYGGQGKPRWAKCDHILTVSLDRCTDPYKREAYSKRQYVKVKAIKADMDALEKCVLWALGINPQASQAAP